MHRSGTSATAGLLIGHGLTGPPADDLVPPSPSNERGHWESRAVNRCNTRLLATWGATAFAPPQLSPGWEEAREMAPFREDAHRWFTTTFAGAPVVLKDPRLCLTLPLWRSAIPGPMGAVLVLRDPMDVARSLHARDNLPIVVGLAMWDRYLRSAAAGLDGLPTLVLRYDVLLADPVTASESVGEFLGLLGIAGAGDPRDIAAGSIDPALRHHDAGADDSDALVHEEREVLAVLSARPGMHDSWQPPLLPPAPTWVDEVLTLRREYESVRRELGWIKTSRAYRFAGAVWRRTGQRPTGLHNSDAVVGQHAAP